MARVAARYGTTVLVATPHRYWTDHENTPTVIRRLTAQVQEALAQTKLGRWITVLPGQEIPLTLQTAEELKAGAVLTLGESGVYALVEPPFDRLFPWTTQALENITAAGFHPVLAHPERNVIIQKDPRLVTAFVEAGAILQLTTLSITGENGTRAQAASHWVLERGLPAIVSSDSHSPLWRPPNLRTAFHALEARYGLATAQRLCIELPQAIVQGIRPSHSP